MNGTQNMKRKIRDTTEGNYFDQNKYYYYSLVWIYIYINKYISVYLDAEKNHKIIN